MKRGNAMTDAETTERGVDTEVVDAVDEAPVDVGEDAATGEASEASEADEGSEASEADEADEGSEAGEDLEERLVAEGEIAGDYLEELLDLLDFDGDIDLDVEGNRA